MTDIFSSGDTVKIIAGGWTIDQRRELWVVDLIGCRTVTIHQRDNPNRTACIRDDHIAHSTLLDLIVHAIDESDEETHDG